MRTRFSFSRSTSRCCLSDDNAIVTLNANERIIQKINSIVSMLLHSGQKMRRFVLQLKIVQKLKTGACVGLPRKSCGKSNARVDDLNLGTIYTSMQKQILFHPWHHISWLSSGSSILTNVLASYNTVAGENKYKFRLTLNSPKDGRIVRWMVR